MAVLNYTYLKLKMSGPNGIITVSTTSQHAYQCDVECIEQAEALADCPSSPASVTVTKTSLTPSVTPGASSWQKKPSSSSSTPRPQKARR